MNQSILHLLESDEKFPNQVISLAGSFNSWDITQSYLKYNVKCRIFEFEIETCVGEEISYKFYLHSTLDGGGAWIEPSDKHTTFPLRQVISLS